MIDPSVLPAFFGMILVFLAPPGPDMAYMLAVGLQGGRRAAVQAILGIGAGMSVYAAAVVIGLGRLAEQHPRLLTILELAGAAYLAWLAVLTVRGAHDDAAAEVTPGNWFLRGAWVSLSNPKLILFFLAVLPRFTGAAGDTTAQLALLGAINVATEVVLYGAIGVLAGAFHTRFTARTGARTRLNQLAAAVYAVLACLIVVDVVR